MKYTTHLNSKFTKWLWKTFVLGTLIIPIQYFGLLNWLDILVLEAGQYNSVEHVIKKNAKSSNQVTVLELSQEMYENHFNNSSPLNKSVLNEVFRNITTASPKTLSVDFDLSPNNPNSQFKEPIYQTLKKMVNEGVHVNLALPFGVNTERLYQSNLNWFNSMCLQGIEFAEALVFHDKRNALRLPKVNKNGPASLYEQTAIANGELNKKSLCDKNRNHQSNFSIKSRLYGVDNTFHQHFNINSLEIININQFDSINVITIDSPEDILEYKSFIKDKTVFLGGSFGTNDVFYVAGNKIPGVRLTAVSYLTLLKPITSSGSYALMLEVFLGVIYLFLLEKLWVKRNAFSADLNFYAKRLSIDIILISFTFLYITITAIVITPLFLQLSLWLSPAPIVAALLLDTYLTPIKSNTNQSIRTLRCGANKIILYSKKLGEICLGLFGLYLVFFA